MSFLSSEVRPGAYYDSIVLMRLQAALAGLPGILDAGVVMATQTNLELLKASGLRPEEAGPEELGSEAPDQAGADDLLVVVKAKDEAAANEALAGIDALLTGTRSAAESDFRPRSLESAVKLLPAARWVLISVPGRHATGVAERALDLGRNVFLYSDNVSLEDEIALKRKAREKRLMVLGPDCGTAIVAGVGLGFANRVAGGPIGLVGASGTGLQAITSRIHNLGSGVSHALGTGGRDLKQEVGAITALQGLDLLTRDDATKVIVLVSKPPSPGVAARLLEAARAAGKPVVVSFLGYASPATRLGNLHFARSLADAAALAVELVGAKPDPGSGDAPRAKKGYLRGLFSGGTLALEALQTLRALVHPLFSNLGDPGVAPFSDPARSEGNAILDLGSDEYTVGRLHPMMDPDLRLRRLRQEAADRQVGALLLDVVLGDGSHQSPAGALAPEIEAIKKKRPEIEVAVIVVGTDLDPQDRQGQIESLKAAGAEVFDDTVAAVVHLCAGRKTGDLTGIPAAPMADAESVAPPLAAINVGLELFYDSLVDQGAEAVHVEWRPPAGGNEKLMSILEKMRSR